MEEEGKGTWGRQTGPSLFVKPVKPLFVEPLSVKPVKPLFVEPLPVKPVKPLFVELLEPLLIPDFGKGL